MAFRTRATVLTLVAVACAAAAYAVYRSPEPGEGGSVLGSVVYEEVVLTSPTNRSLRLGIQALEQRNGTWTYKLRWNRTAKTRVVAGQTQPRTGTLQVTPRDDRNAVVPLNVDGGNVAPEGEATLDLRPCTRYRVEFFAQPGAQGTLLLRKFFNTLSESGTACLGQPQGGAGGAAAVVAGLVSGPPPGVVYDDAFMQAYTPYYTPARQTAGTNPRPLRDAAFIGTNTAYNQTAQSCTQQVPDLKAMGVTVWPVKSPRAAGVDEDVLDLQAPAGGEVWALGSKQKIAWNLGKGGSESVSIALYPYTEDCNASGGIQPNNPKKFCNDVYFKNHLVEGGEGVRYPDYGSGRTPRNGFSGQWGYAALIDTAVKGNEYEWTVGNLVTDGEPGSPPTLKPGRYVLYIVDNASRLTLSRSSDPYHWDVSRSYITVVAPGAMQQTCAQGAPNLARVKDAIPLVQGWSIAYPPESNFEPVRNITGRLFMNGARFGPEGVVNSSFFGDPNRVVDLPRCKVGNICFLSGLGVDRLVDGQSSAAQIMGFQGYACLEGSLPPGMFADANTDASRARCASFNEPESERHGDLYVISGVPTQAGTYEFRFVSNVGHPYRRWGIKVPDARYRIVVEENTGRLLAPAGGEQVKFGENIRISWSGIKSSKAAIVVQTPYSATTCGQGGGSCNERNSAARKLPWWVGGALLAVVDNNQAGTNSFDWKIGYDPRDPSRLIQQTQGSGLPQEYFYYHTDQYFGKNVDAPLTFCVLEIPPGANDWLNYDCSRSQAWQLHNPAIPSNQYGSSIPENRRVTVTGLSYLGKDPGNPNVHLLEVSYQAGSEAAGRRIGFQVCYVQGSGSSEVSSGDPNAVVCSFTNQGADRYGPASTGRFTLRYDSSVSLQQFMFGVSPSGAAKGNRNIRIGYVFEEPCGSQYTWSCSSQGIAEYESRLWPVPAQVYAEQLGSGGVDHIITSTLPAATVGRGYGVQLSGSTSVRSWQISSSGTGLAWLQQSQEPSERGWLSGVPTRAGDFTLTVEALDAAGQVLERKQFLLRVSAP